MTKGRCAECASISREIAEVLAEVLRARGKAAQQQATRRRDLVLRLRRQHELRTGHRFA